MLKRPGASAQGDSQNTCEQKSFVGFQSFNNSSIVLSQSSSAPLAAPHEELNQIIQGGNYGYPNCWDAQDTPECKQMIPAVAFFEPHSSADGLDFNAGSNFPEEYKNNAFVGIFGSWLKQGVQTGIERVVLNSVDGKIQSQVSWFAKFPAGAMPLPVLFGPDGAL